MKKRKTASCPLCERSINPCAVLRGKPMGVMLGCLPFHCLDKNIPPRDPTDPHKCLIYDGTGKLPENCGYSKETIWGIYCAEIETSAYFCPTCKLLFVEPVETNTYEYELRTETKRRFLRKSLELYWFERVKSHRRNVVAVQAFRKLEGWALEKVHTPGFSHCPICGRGAQCSFGRLIYPDGHWGEEMFYCCRNEPREHAIIYNTKYMD